VIQDLDMIIKLVERGEELVAGDHVSFQYRRHTASESAKQAIDGRRFAEARAFFLETADHLDSVGWSEAAAVSRRHRSARLHALSLVPAAIKLRRPDSVRQLLRYATSPSKRLGA
jgi:hypothetical protein